MHHFESWEHGWFYFPATMCFIMFIIMAICLIYFYRKRRVFFNSSRFRQNWSRDWFSDCFKNRRVESAIDILEKRYARGEINKDVFEQMKKDISDFSK